jgi:ABC-type lipoprotein export system ATPase subunit
MSATAGRQPGVDATSGAAAGRPAEVGGRSPATERRSGGRRSDGRRSGEPVILCDGVVKIFKVADLEVVALQGLDLVVDPGEFIAIVGASGSGKSTLLSILGGLDVPSAGRVVVDGHLVGEMDAAERTAYRRKVLGFVWQQTARNLLPYLTAYENVELPMLLEGVGRKQRSARAASLLELVGLSEHAGQKPGTLSGGEQQRVAIAVALANEPAVILADEPTGELDTVTAHEIFDLLRDVNRRLGVTIVVVTHDPLVSEQVSRTVAIRDGRTSTETLRRSALNEAGDHHVIAEEYAVLDRVGRLQLPRAHVDTLGLQRRVRLVLEDTHLEIWPADEHEGEGLDGTGGSGGDSNGTDTR